MAQKADENYNRDFQNAYTRADNQNKWIWGVLAALVALGLIVWFATSGGPNTATTPSITQQKSATTPDTPAVTPPAQTTTGSGDATVPAATPPASNTTGSGDATTMQPATPPASSTTGSGDATTTQPAAPAAPAQPATQGQTNP